ncbi:CvpA family protein [Thalassovita taeanensis]|uniref:Membrane protein required for colicin V production n=1 Tax=Thalassovita taeanensis TaxID=657014 RepID=A0A1H9FTX1_9RHOB|nr:CvpA family protein [Thalassovita taeanensis]SEQ40943.1 membrane protein required for colicin V production [Thalassovita taeanensis]
MDGFTIIDGVVALVIILSALLAYSRGLVREALAIAGWVAAAVLAFIFAPQVQPLVKEIPVVGDFISDSCELSIISAFAAVFALALVLASLFTPLFSSLVQRSALGGLDQGLGFLFGVLRGILLVAIAFFVYETVVTSQDITMVDDSRSAKVFGRMTGKIEDRDPEQALGWITQQYEQLVGVCEK